MIVTVVPSRLLGSMLVIAPPVWVARLDPYIVAIEDGARVVSGPLAYRSDGQPNSNGVPPSEIGP